MFIKEKEGHGVTGVAVDLSVREAQVLKSVMQEVMDMLKSREERDPPKGDTKVGQAPRWISNLPTDHVQMLVETVQKLDIFVKKITVSVPSMQDVYDELFKADLSKEEMRDKILYAKPLRNEHKSD